MIALQTCRAAVKIYTQDSSLLVDAAWFGELRQDEEYCADSRIGYETGQYLSTKILSEIFRRSLPCQKTRWVEHLSTFNARAG
jgi:hypothetical protein